MKKAGYALVVLGLVAGQAAAQQSPWQIRARVVNIDTANKSDPLPALGLGRNDITVSDKAIPEVDISYFFTPHIAAELVLTYPQKHTVRAAGARIGSFRHLPPTLSLQYHFTPQSSFSPYVGAGVNYTRISSVSLLGGAADLENDSFGLALQAGFDYKLDKHWSLNFDVKKVQIRSDVAAAGTRVSKVKVDPLLIGVGVGYRF